MLKNAGCYWVIGFVSFCLCVMVYGVFQLFASMRRIKKLDESFNAYCERQHEEFEAWRLTRNRKPQ